MVRDYLLLLGSILWHQTCWPWSRVWCAGSSSCVRFHIPLITARKITEKKIVIELGERERHGWYMLDYCKNTRAFVLRVVFCQGSNGMVDQMICVETGKYIERVIV